MNFKKYFDLTEYPKMWQIILISFLIVAIILTSFLLNKYLLNDWSNTLSIVSAFVLGLAALFFTYWQYVNYKNSEKPRIGLDLTIDEYKYGQDHEIVPTGTDHLFIVIKNIGSIPIYNLQIELNGTYIDVNNDAKLRKTSSISLFPNQFKLFNTGHSVESLNNISKAICIISYFDDKTKRYYLEYDLIKNKEYIIDNFANLNPNKEWSARHNFLEFEQYRQNLGEYTISEDIKNLNRTVERLKR